MDYYIKKYGAVGDGIIDDTVAVQKAIDAISDNGGGRLVFDKGQYLVGTVFLKSYVELFLDINAVIIADDKEASYNKDTCRQMYRDETEMDRCLFYADSVTDITISGGGMIDGRGELFNDFRPMMFRYKDSKNIRLSGIRLQNPASWTNAFIGCKDIWVDGIDISSRANANGDGLDFDCCENVFISNSKMNCSDDCICLQTSESTMKTKNITVINCQMESKWAGMRIGLLSCGNIENVTVSNCIFRNIDCSGLKIQSAEGAILQNMMFNNLVMENVQRPVFITTSHYRERVEWPLEVKGKSVVRQMTFSNIRATTKEEGYSRIPKVGKLPSCMIVDGVEEGVITDLVFDNIRMYVHGGGSREESEWRDIPTWNKTDRAEAYLYGRTLPATGLFVRNASEVDVTNLKVFKQATDMRKDIYFY